MKALRHWDSIGMLKPALVDEATGYRYYAIEQVGEVNRIHALRAMGLGLEQVRKILNDRPTTDDIRAMLRLRQAELEQEIHDATAMLQIVESRLKQIDFEGMLPEYEVTVRSAPAQPIIAVREVVPTMQVLVDLLQETYPYARQRGGTNLLAVFHDDGYYDTSLDVEIGFPIENERVKTIPLKQDREMRLTLLPEVEQLACTIHRGEWLTLSQGYLHLGTWVERNGYEIVGSGREIFHHIDWDGEQHATVTELQFPVSKRTS